MRRTPVTFCPEPDVQLVLLDEALHQLEEVLLLVLLARQAAVQRQVHRLQQDHLPPRVVEQRAAEVALLLEHEEGQPALGGGQRRGQARGPGARR